ncbi:MAG TPA: acyl-CoA dehydrogenase family protein [Trebonia sp.]|jgi:alkylation response protein AidB-like acyl-CoA dehydrogenase|nr:acyl-CoA dehydrogenase family protein [Trebonia sp.]
MDLEAGLGEALRTDYFMLREEFTPAQLDYLQRTRGFVHEEVLPVINGYWERGRLADLAIAGRVEPTLAGLAKSHNTTAAREVLAEARDLLGGNGILLDFHVIRHMADIEAIHTFEGTATIQNLIVGRDITGVSAFTAGA